MKRRDLLRFEQGAIAAGKLRGVRFAFAVNKNLALIRPEIEAILKAVEPYEEFKKYDEKRLELCKKHAKKDDKGNPIIKKINDSTGSYELIDTNAFEQEYEQLKQLYIDAIHDREDQLKAYELFMAEEATVELIKIKPEELPEDISVEQMENLKDMIEGLEDETIQAENLQQVK